MAGEGDPLKIKLVVVGDGTVGKTCLLMCYCKGEVPKEYVPTVFENFVVSLTAGGRMTELVLFDTAGQEEYDRLRPLSYANANVILICFSLMSRTSLNNVNIKWIKEVRHHQAHAPVILVGTKRDLRGDPDELERLRKEQEEPVSEEDARHMMRTIGAVAYVECSAYNNDNVKAAFDEAIRAYFDLVHVNPPPRPKKFCTLL
eukprot:TRINITY_DN295_c0_g1_i1.p1 TRINITY_DN295_c0_g1~~TRINITY_DN295_c0_g1_i1.p1  ORF type:complete len:202 (+),score=32.75 TRINITY_DN295_c0_g1_i1:279-884(+)